MRELPPSLLRELVDVHAPAPQHGWTITWNEMESRWEASPGTGGALLTDDAAPLVFLTVEDEAAYLVEG